MNKLLKSGISILMICWLSNANAQVVLHGKVIDNQSGEEIPFASIQIVNTALGTASDDKGEFILKIDPEFYDDTLKVSCIGYSNTMFAIQALKDSSMEEFTIRLDPFVGYLDEVEITGTRASPEEFLREAIKAIPDNFIQQPFNMEFYSHISVHDSAKVLFSIESVSLIYKEGYSQEAYYKAKILQKRVTGTIPLAFYEYYKGDKNLLFPFSPGTDIAIADVVAMGFSAFNPDNLRRYKFNYAGVSIFDQDTVVAIKYSRKNWFNGIIYIAVNNLAIIRHTRNVKKGWNKYRDVIYKNLNGYYFPYKLKTILIPSHDKTLSVVDEIFIKNIETDNVVPLEWEYYYIPKDVPYNEAYWNANYPMKK